MTPRMSKPTVTPEWADQSQGLAPADLPPVEAPTAGFIVQLFVIPAVVVAVVIVVWLLFGKLAGGERDAMDYVRQLHSPSANWRAAFELASLIQNDPKLARDPVLLGELTDLLEQDLAHGEDPELTRYVALTLGAFQTLDARLTKGRPVDPLATLASALGAARPAGVRFAAAASLAKHAARLDGRLEDAEAVRALGSASQDSNVELRQMAVYALGFFGGEAAAGILRERLNDEDRFVRYNAAIALGRLGDPAALGNLREMLSPDDLAKVIRLETKSETSHKIEAIELEALQALQTSTRRGKPGLARELRPNLVTLSRSGLVGVRNQAQELLRNGTLADPEPPRDRPAR